jgi:hypothetical protein
MNILSENTVIILAIMGGLLLVVVAFLFIANGHVREFRWKLDLEWCFWRTRQQLERTLRCIEFNLNSVDETPRSCDIILFRKMQRLVADTLDEGLLWDTSGREVMLRFKIGHTIDPSKVISYSDYAWSTNQDLLAWLMDVIRLYADFANHPIDEETSSTTINRPREFDSLGKEIPTSPVNQYEQKLHQLMVSMRMLLHDDRFPAPTSEFAAELINSRQISEGGDTIGL